MGISKVTPVETDIELVARIVAACDIIENMPAIFVRVQQNLVRRCHACIKVGGRQFEHCCKMQNGMFALIGLCATHNLLSENAKITASNLLH